MTLPLKMEDLLIFPWDKVKKKELKKLYSNVPKKDTG